MVAVTLISVMVIGVSHIFAEPTIEDLVEAPEIGTFVPDHPYNDKEDAEKIKLAAWLNITQIMFSYDVWTDTSGDGAIDVEDVYTQDGFANEMLMGNMVYPIYEIDKESNYYVIPLPDYKFYEGVVIEMQIGENNDLARLKDPSTYWYDRENSYLYIDKNMIQKDIENEFYNSIRMESIMLVKEIDDATKDIDIITVFDPSITDTYGLEKTTPNGTYTQNMKEWLAGGLSYQLVNEDQLAYVSSENFTVFVNYTETSEWTYDAITGKITINCSPYATRNIAVKFNQLNDATISQKLLQYFQAKTKTDTAQCAGETSFEQAFKGDNLFLKYIQYDNQEPVAGTMQELGFALFVYEDWKNGNYNTIVANNHSVVYSAEPIPIETVRSVTEKAITTRVGVDQYYRTTTISAHQDGRNVSGADLAYGEVLYNVFLASVKKDSSALDRAISISQNKLFSSITPDDQVVNTGMAYTMSTTWCFSGYNGRYIAGTNQNEFLGGTIKDDGGKPFFDVVCGRIEAPSSVATYVYDQDPYDDMNNYYGQGSANGNTDYRTNATILKVVKNESGDGGYLYVCIWSRSLNKGDPMIHTQRVLAFSRIPYRYNGNGQIRLTKTEYGNSNVAIENAQYTIYKDAACTEVVEVLTTGSAPVTSSELPAGTYYVKEKGKDLVYETDENGEFVTDENGEFVLKKFLDNNGVEIPQLNPNGVPVGYLLDPEVHVVTVTGGETVALNVEDKPQNCQFTLTVYDETTRNDIKMPVEGIVFNLYDYSGDYAGQFTTNKQGQISGDIRATGIYTLEQVGTVKDYHTNDECKCIRIDATPTDSGEPIIWSNVHYEPRQSIVIKSQVQDENLKEKTPAELGGEKDTVYNTGGGYVTTLGAQYRLIAKNDLFLGYYNGNKITASAGSELTIYTKAKDGSREYNKIATSYSENNQAYIIADGIQVERNGKTLEFPLPNGEYQWELINASSGYYDNEKKTYVDAKWKDVTDNVEKLDVETAVTQTRQATSINLIVKSYTSRNRVQNVALNALGYSIRNNAHTSLLPPSKVEEGESWIRWVNTKHTKDVTSNMSSVQKDSEEIATLFVGGSPTLSIHSSGVSPNTVYALTNLIDIVDIDTGKVIEAGTLLGYHITDENGKMSITSLGSDEHDNPNAESNIKKIPAVQVLAKDGTSVDGNLPNGIYGLTVHIAAAKHRNELYLGEDIITSLSWCDPSQPVITAQSVTFLYYDDPQEPDVITVPVAPDPPYDIDTPNEDYYDPNNPDDEENLDDSDDIPIVGKQWVDENQYNISYRIVDSENIGEDEIKEVNDAFPTTFAFYFKNALLYDDIYKYKYDLSFYYEITKEEYDAASADAKANREYIKDGDKYARRFATDKLSGGEWLQDIIVLNELSTGYINYNEAKENKTISGAIYNTEWLNEKLAAQANGEYHIFIYADITISYVTKGSNEYVEIYDTERARGVLTIKNRQLVNLD